MPRSFRNGIAFFAPDEKIDLLVRWYHNLPDGNIKDSIQLIRYSPDKRETADDISIFCLHPFSSHSPARLVSPSSSSPSGFDATEPPIRDFLNWIECGLVPTSQSIDFPFVARWWPMELIHQVTVSTTSPTLTQIEMCDHSLDCLELIRFAIIEDAAFTGFWRESNEPFFAAGRIAGADFEWINHFPEDWQSGPEFRKEINGTLIEFAREYLGLFRMASSIGHISPLMENLATEIGAFCGKYISHIPRWNELARKCLDLDDAMADPLELMSPADYESIVRASNCLRSQLARATERLESQIPGMVNSFLPDLSLPESAGYFQNLDQD